jgi:hypothetical protein
MSGGLDLEALRRRHRSGKRRLRARLQARRARLDQEKAIQDLDRAAALTIRERDEDGRTRSGAL